MNRINWKKGGGEYIGYSISMVLLSYLFILIISFMILNSAMGTIENASALISRDIVTCSSLDEAREKAQKEAEQYLSQCGNIQSDSIRADVGYAAGSDTEWEKGNFLEVTITGYVQTCEPFTSGNKVSSATIMIENSGGS